MATNSETPNTVKRETSSLLRNEQKRTIIKIKALAASLVLGAGGIVAGSLYGEAHAEKVPIRLPKGAKELKSPDDNTAVFLIPTTAAENFDCGGANRPLIVDQHNDKHLIAQIGSKTIVECHLEVNVPVIRP